MDGQLDSDIIQTAPRRFNVSPTLSIAIENRLTYQRIAPNFHDRNTQITRMPIELQVLHIHCTFEN